MAAATGEAIPNRRFVDKVVLITGTGGGMGREAALRFAAEGAAVAGCDVKAEGNEETAKRVRERGGRMRADTVDLGDPEQCRAWIERAAEQFGRIDILYNNASAARFGTIAELSVEDWHFTLRNELDLVFYATKFAWPHLARNGGVIINTASVAGLRATASAGIGAHAATKGAVHAFTRQAALEGATHGIRAVSISPGFTLTPGTAMISENPAVRDALIASVPLRRIALPADIVGTVLFLASDEAAYITGTDIVIDGGKTST
jgi:NAD(P)-dependent dehydrogenase (short-subunit alcohol dehydrogenase family)